MGMNEQKMRWDHLTMEDNSKRFISEELNNRNWMETTFSTGVGDLLNPPGWVPHGFSEHGKNTKFEGYSFHMMAIL